MKILVTGGAGFVGTNLVKKLLAEKHEVISIDNYSTGKKENHIYGATYVDKDLRDGVLEDSVDCVFHLASLARIGPSFENPEKTIEVNFNITLNVLKYCRKRKIPMIYAGTSSHHSGRFKNPYTFSKDISEDLIGLYQKLFEVKATITRFYNVYGPHHLTEGEYCTLIGKWETKFKNQEPLVIYGDGTKRRDFTHVDDIVNALYLILEKKSWGYVFELGRGKNHSVSEIASFFGSEVIYTDNKIGEAQNTLCEDKLATEVLGWEPKNEVSEYIKDFVKLQEKIF